MPPRRSVVVLVFLPLLVYFHLHLHVFERESTASPPLYGHTLQPNTRAPSVYNPYKSDYGCENPAGEVYAYARSSTLKPQIGSYDLLGLDGSRCFEREARLGAYGFRDVKIVPRRTSVDWKNVDWGRLQRECVGKNQARFLVRDADDGGLKSREHLNETVEQKTPRKKPSGKARTAVLLRAYSGMKYTDNDMHTIRSIIAELSLRSGGEYQVYLLVQLKDDDNSIWNGAAPYDRAVKQHVPKEFWGITILWTDSKMREWYPKVPPEVNNVHQSQWLSVQKFTQEHPEFSYVWNWELDSRYTGHHYDLLEKLADFAKKQPRKGLWERNERFYIPGFHTSSFKSKFRSSIEKISGTESVWGAPSVEGLSIMGPQPPTEMQRDRYDWGVGEDADLITLAPIFNPVNTTWPGRNDVWGYSGPDITPRRATIGTQARLSAKLLSAMHLDNKAGSHVSSEMGAQTVALLHGFKAVYAPIPVFFDHSWNATDLEATFNPGPKGVSGSCEQSPFSWGREGSFEGSTWYFRAVAAGRVYNHWMGWEDGGLGGREWEERFGRICLPAMLLHPVKDVVERGEGYQSTSDLPY